MKYSSIHQKIKCNLRFDYGTIFVEFGDRRRTRRVECNLMWFKFKLKFEIKINLR